MNAPCRSVLTPKSINDDAALTGAGFYGFSIANIDADMVYFFPPPAVAG